MSRFIGGLVVAGALVFVGVLAVNAGEDGFYTLKELNSYEAAHAYCEQGCKLVSREDMAMYMEMLSEAYNQGLQEGIAAGAGKK
jgi:hypothetical protein